MRLRYGTTTAISIAGLPPHHGDKKGILMSYCVYVQDKDGNPLMPTTRFGWVRRSLKSGKAVVVQSHPFTIQLTYEPETFRS